MLRSRIIGCGAYLPEKVLTNDDLAKTVDTSNDWIVGRTGITQRHIAADGQLTSDLALAAAERAVSAAGISVDELDLLILATSTPDNTFPATAAKVQARLGMHQGAAFDVQAVCAGFICALSVADKFLLSGQAKKALIIGAETYSRILDWNDRTTCVLFGDGAGAAVLSAENSVENGAERGILAVKLHSDGRHYDALYVDGGVSSSQTSGHLRMQGKEVYRHAVVNLAAVAGEAMEAAGLAPSDIDWLVPHQANLRIMNAIARRLDLPPEKMVVTVDRHANTSSASIPLALVEAIEDGRIKSGDVVLMEAIGGGFVWGSAVARW
ncbi:MAG: 3-oxoacyl-[acyl-carrier-protein] synthase 3 [Alphaproteobacteria bacterium MarineAlpha10_Bin2]|nr:MAG: 3-oxoacyl-[acyl-carrier-protein] synthase 3 [Alphaproteobacteria bacterium MarineAlpha10_Bin2]